MKLLSLAIITFLIFCPFHTVSMDNNTEIDDTDYIDEVDPKLDEIIENIRSVWQNYTPESKREQLSSKALISIQSKCSLRITTELPLSLAANPPVVKEEKKHPGKTIPLQKRKKTMPTRRKARRLKKHYDTHNLQEQQLSTQKENDLSNLLYKQYNVTNMTELRDTLESFCNKNNIRDFFEPLDESHYVKYRRGTYSIDIVNDTFKTQSNQERK
jgi:hypothetical protein